MKTPEQQVQEAMASLDGMARARAPHEFAGRVLDRLGVLGRRQRLVSPSRLWMAAAGLLLLLSANLYLVRQQAHSGRQLAQQHDLRAFGDRYFASAASNELP